MSFCIICRYHFITNDKLNTNIYLQITSMASSSFSLRCDRCSVAMPTSLNYSPVSLIKSLYVEKSQLWIIVDRMIMTLRCNLRWLYPLFIHISITVWLQTIACFPNLGTFFAENPFHEAIIYGLLIVWSTRRTLKEQILMNWMWCQVRETINLLFS